jgi:hypothetical protein
MAKGVAGSNERTRAKGKALASAVQLNEAYVRGGASTDTNKIRTLIDEKEGK